MAILQLGETTKNNEVLMIEPTSPTSDTSKTNKTQESTTGTWTISVTGISETSGFLVQASHTVENGDLKLAMKGLSQITEMFKERRVVAVAPMLADALGKVITAPLGDIAASFPAPASAPDEIKSVKVSALKLMYTENGNPYLHVKAQPGLMKHGLNAWMESWEPLLGNDKVVMAEYGVAKDIPVPASMQFAWASYKGGIAQKIIGFSNSPDSAKPVG